MAVEALLDDGVIALVRRSSNLGTDTGYNGPNVKP